MKEIVQELLPPDDNGRPLSSLTRWRLAVFATCCSMLLFMSWALSPWGFALADSVNRLKGNVDEMQLTQIEQGVYSLKEWECSSTDLGAQRFFSGKIAELNRRYQSLTNGAKIDIPPCRVRGAQVNEPNRPSTNF